jgi:hypothetical protein
MATDFVEAGSQLDPEKERIKQEFRGLISSCYFFKCFFFCTFLFSKQLRVWSFILKPINPCKHVMGEDLLQPTQELVKDIFENDDVKNGLEDPDIMAAVSDIAANPSAIDKYKHNKKVVTFYNQLGKFMGQQIKKQDEKLVEK